MGVVLSIGSVVAKIPLEVINIDQRECVLPTYEQGVLQTELGVVPHIVSCCELAGLMPV